MLICLANATTPTRTNRRSCSAPGRTRQTDTLRTHESVSMEHYEIADVLLQDIKEEIATTGDCRKSLKRASSLLLPAELDLILPTYERRSFDADGRNIEVTSGPAPTNIFGEGSQTEIRPAVPPKTPPKMPTQPLHVSPLKLRPTKVSAFDKALPQIGPLTPPPWTTDESPRGQGELKHVRDYSGDSGIDRGRP